MATTPTKLLTFEEFQVLPDPPGGRYELHHGELFKVAEPKFPHVRAQWQLRRLLENAAGDAGIVDKEFPYRPLPQHEAWRADVAYMPRARWDSVKDYFFGAPDLVVEVLSPSNTAAELAEKRKLCLENGSREFWVVNPAQREVEVWTPDDRCVTYKSSQQIPLFFGGSLPVDAIFA